MKNLLLHILLIVLITNALSCKSIKLISQTGKEIAIPNEFKETLPLELVKNKIFVQVNFKKENKTRKLSIDTQSSFSILGSKEMEQNNSFKDIGEFFIKPKDPLGHKIPNRFYMSDSVGLGSVLFNNVVFRTGEIVTVNDRHGILGRNILDKCVVKIDFENNLFTIASKPDSLAFNGASVLDCKFNSRDVIEINVTANNYNLGLFKLDLGLNGFLTLPKKEFDKIENSKNAKIIKTTVITVAGKQEITQYSLNNATLNIGGEKSSNNITSYDTMKSKLVGVAFFSQYKYVVLDYVNKKVHLGEKKD